MSPLDLNRNRATEFRTRGIPDRQHVTDPEAKRVLDALAETVGQLTDQINTMKKALNQAENKVAAKDATADSAVEDKPDANDNSNNQVLQAQKSVEIVEGNKIQFKNDSNPPAKYIYVSDATGKRRWMSDSDFVSDIIGNSLTQFLNTYMVGYIETKSVQQYVCTGVQYAGSEFQQVLVAMKVLGVVGGSTIVGTVFTTKPCPEE